MTPKTPKARATAEKTGSQKDFKIRDTKPKTAWAIDERGRRYAVRLVRVEARLLFSRRVMSGGYSWTQYRPMPSNWRVFKTAKDAELFMKPGKLRPVWTVSPYDGRVIEFERSSDGSLWDKDGRRYIRERVFTTKAAAVKEAVRVLQKIAAGQARVLRSTRRKIQEAREQK